VAARKQVSLFPFLDILACVIGNLILIITAVVLEQADTEPVAEAARIDALEAEVERNTVAEQQLQQELEKLQETLGSNAKQLAEARARLTEATKAATEARKQLREIPNDTPELDPTLVTKEQQLAEAVKKLEDEAAKIELEIEQRQTPPEQAIALLPAAQSDERLKAPSRTVFIEVAKEGLVVHEGDEPWKVARDKIADMPRLQKLLATLKGDERAIVTFLLRPDALDVLPLAEQAARKAGARTGRVPLPGDGVLDLSRTGLR
jgi:hypothetical protein